MDPSPTLVVLVVVWLVGGLGGWWWLRHRGHRHPAWLLYSLVLGPLAIPVLAGRAEPAPVVVGGPARPRPPGDGAARDTGPVLVVGVDRSDGSRAALEAALRVAGGRPGCLVLCAVVDHDTAAGDEQAVAEVRRALTDSASAVPAPLTVLVEVRGGRPVEALVAAAADHEADLVVVGTRGRGLSRRLLGSVAEGLLERSPAPVLVATRGSAADAPP